jgi:hypothetical protein
MSPMGLPEVGPAPNISPSVTPKIFASFKIKEIDLIVYFCEHLT